MSPRPARKQLSAIAVIAATGAMILPATASAAVTGSVIGNAATLTGDDNADNITIGEAAGLLTHNLGAPFNSATDFDSTLAGDQTIAAAATSTLVVTAGGGDDTITITAATALAADSAFDGGAGNDLITGGNAADNLHGGDGNDRVVGGKGNDGIDGGAGNDVLVWNNGDGSDVMDGDVGADEIEVNGAPTAGDDFTIKPNGRRVRFDRVNLGLFNLDIGSSERLTVNGLGGNDKATGDPGLAPLILLTLNGGVGVDTVSGGDGPDLINGGDENDVLDGGAGDDRIVGDRGNDTMTGGAGDDTLVWNNGDGSDVMDGQDGLDRIEVNGSPTAGDVFVVAPNGARTKFDRTNLGPFTLDIGSAESLDVRGLGGDDSLTVAAGGSALLAVSTDGGAGNDALTGAEGNESFAGGSGDDVLTGGAGFDVLDGQAGNDRLELRDGVADLARGGDGNDSATADASNIDALVDVETIDRPAVVTPDTTGTAVLVLTTRATVQKKAGKSSAKLTVSCPASESGGCTGTLTLFGDLRIGGERVTVVLGSAAYKLTAGERKTVAVRVSNRLRRLAGKAKLATKAETVTRDAAGNVATQTSKVTLTLPRAY